MTVAGFNHQHFLNIEIQKLSYLEKEKKNLKMYFVNIKTIMAYSSDCQFKETVVLTAI